MKPPHFLSGISEVFTLVPGWKRQEAAVISGWGTSPASAKFFHLEEHPDYEADTPVPKLV